MIRKAFVLLTLSLCASLSAWSQTRASESLRGLHGVFLYVHPVGKDVEDGGLTTLQVHNAAEKALRQAGIPVHSEPQPADGSANLIITINIVKHPQGPYLYGVTVSFLQEVHLARTKEAEPFPAQTWDAMAFGLTSPNRTDLILEPLMSKVNEFIDAYRSVNPTKHE